MEEWNTEIMEYCGPEKTAEGIAGVRSAAGGCIAYLVNLPTEFKIARYCRSILAACLFSDFKPGILMAAAVPLP
jgi:hypothetical protein